MGLTESKPAQVPNDYYSKKLRLKKLEKQLRNKRIQTIQRNETDVSTINWITESTLGFTDTMKGGSSMKISNENENENLNKLNTFIRSLDTDSESSNNFELYQNDIKALEKYISQNGGYDKFNGMPLNVFYSNYLSKLKGGNDETKDEDDSDSDSDMEELNDEMENEDEEDEEGESSSESDEEKRKRTRRVRRTKKESGLTQKDMDEEVEELNNYIRQNGGFDKFEGRLLNIVNSRVLSKIQLVNSEEDKDDLSTINFSDRSENNLFMKKMSGGYRFNKYSATSPIVGNLTNINLSQTSNNTMNGGGNSATSVNSMVNLNNLPIFSETSVSTSMVGGGILRRANKNTNNESENQTVSATSMNSRINLDNLPRFSETSFSENVMNGGAKESNEDSESSSEEEVMGSSDSSSESEELNNDSDTTESSDTVKMARMIAKQRVMSETESEKQSEEEVSSTTTESEMEDSEDKDSEEESETSDNDTSSESSDSRRNRRKNMSRSKSKKSSKTKKTKKSKKSSRKYYSENSLTQSTEFKAVPFYSSENSTDFYRNYQIKNRFN